ncbi:MAG: hypothetical protein LBI45_09215 [Bacteroidales bacterium]|jgi:rubredoxin|nr:hypothetical protein [Bacteroidales bacterium]
MKNLNKIKGISVLSIKQMKKVKGGVRAGESSKTDACKGKALCDTCSWVYQGKEYKGKCSQNVFAGTRYCSDLNCHYVNIENRIEQPIID